ncbi:MAG: type II toxin-antitoxin system RelE/ParE family toxin [Prochloraceae cyanobacterium]|nr:type II toxin-antitoxin system RelE/ParE family toxin [Prochloraceae cyanobacterium]
MRFSFKKKKIEKLYTEEKDAHKYPKNVVDNFFEIIAIIESIESEQDLYTFKGLRFEKLSGKRGNRGERSLRLNDQYRLIIILEIDEEGKYLLIVDIEDYH